MRNGETAKKKNRKPRTSARTVTRAPERLRAQCGDVPTSAHATPPPQRARRRPARGRRDHRADRPIPATITARQSTEKVRAIHQREHQRSVRSSPGARSKPFTRNRSRRNRRNDPAPERELLQPPNRAKGVLAAAQPAGRGCEDAERLAESLRRGRSAVPRQRRSAFVAVWDLALFGISRRSAFRAVRHFAPFGISRRSSSSPFQGRRALGSPVGGGAWSVVAGGPRSSVSSGFNASAQI